MEQYQQAPASPAQRSVPVEQSSNSPTQASRQSEHRSFAAAQDEQAEQRVAADLLQEVAEATHQVGFGLQDENIAAWRACADHALVQTMRLCRPCACAHHVLVQSMCSLCVYHVLLQIVYSLAHVQILCNKH